MLILTLVKPLPLTEIAEFPEKNFNANHKRNIFDCTVLHQSTCENVNTCQFLPHMLNDITGQPKDVHHLCLLLMCTGK